MTNVPLEGEVKAFTRLRADVAHPMQLSDRNEPESSCSDCCL